MKKRLRTTLTLTPTIERPDLALVLGGAKCIEDDLDALAEIVNPWPGLVVACNDAGAAWPLRLDHWATLHPEKLHERWKDGIGDWIVERRERGHPDGYETWSRREPNLVDHVVDAWSGGSSGHLAVKVSKHAGAKRSVLCGIPMEEMPHFHDGRNGEPWPYADAHWKSWTRDAEAIGWTLGWVRSLSGLTKEMLGAPTRKWLGLGEREKGRRI